MTFESYDSVLEKVVVLASDIITKGGQYDGGDINDMDGLDVVMKEAVYSSIASSQHNDWLIEEYGLMEGYISEKARFHSEKHPDEKGIFKDLLVQGRLIHDATPEIQEKLTASNAMRQ